MIGKVVFVEKGFWMENMMSYEGPEKRGERAQTNEGLVLRGESGEFDKSEF